MMTQVLHCPYCQGTDIVRHGTTPEGKQRYRCRACPERGRTFLLEYSYAGQSPDVKQQIVEMAMNASGIRDTARVLHVSPTTVLKELKKRNLTSTKSITRRWSICAQSTGKKAEPRWLWHAIDHHSGTVLAYVFGRRQDAVFLQLQVLLEPFGIRRFYTDGWGAYERHIDPEQHNIGKENTQKIESKHINLRTRIKRLVRRTICFSKTTTMHDLVIGLFINRYEFGRLI
jgi:insertion element IS1 protein InsB